MLGFNHVLAGSIIAVITPAPFVPVVAFATHFLLDLTPHFGQSDRVYPFTRPFKVWLAIDALLCFIALGIAIALFPDKWFIISVGALFGTLPDFLYLLRHHVSKVFDRFLNWAERIQWGERPYGWIFDAFYGLMMVITLYVLAH